MWTVKEKNFLDLFLKVHVDHQDRQVHKADEVHQGQLDRKVKEVLLDLMVQMVMMADLVIQDEMEKMVIQSRDRQVKTDEMALLVSMVWTVLLVRQAHPVLMVNLDNVQALVQILVHRKLNFKIIT